MSRNDVFKRYELKYLLTSEQYIAVREAMAGNMRGDEFGRSDICNLYCDTDSFILARRSIDKPIYKEKLRIRSYGVSNSDSDIFVELKRKYDDEVYKRRVMVKPEGVDGVLRGEHGSQIGREIAYFVKSYEGISPKVYLSYSREAFYAVDDADFRMTFDTNILWRATDLSLSSKIYGTPILKKGQVLLEIKTAAAIPMWLVKVLSANKIYKTSFSKYGAAYMQNENKTKIGECKIA